MKHLGSTAQVVLAGIILATIAGAFACSPIFLRSATKGSLILNASDNQSQLTVPKNWKVDRGLNEKAELAASNRADEMYVVVLTESKQDFQEMTLEKHSEATRGSLVGNLTQPQVGAPRPLTIDGQPAVQYEIRGAIGNLNVVYLHTTVETTKNFHQILAWTLPSRFEKNLTTLETVIESFKEIGSAKSSGS